jgi:hypothetical protein
MKKQLLAFGVGLVAAGFLLAPVGAHVGGTVAHLWNEHLFEKVDNSFLQKFDARSIYLERKRMMWARINADGTVYRGEVSGADPSRTTRLSKGTYRIAFDYSIDECSMTATPERAFYLAKAHAASDDVVEVQMFDLSIEDEDKLANGEFSIQVLC